MPTGNSAKTDPIRQAKWKWKQSTLPLQQTNKQTREAEVLGTFLISLQKLTKKKHEVYVI